MNRIVYSLKINLRSPDSLSIVVDPEKPIGVLRLINSKRNWLTARAGDAVLLTQEGRSDRHFIDSIEL